MARKHVRDIGCIGVPEWPRVEMGATTAVGVAPCAGRIQFDTTTPGRCLLPFEEWVVSHARVAKQPHKGAKLEDTLAFFHQLSTLVNSGTPLLQALKIAAAQCESVKLRTVLEQITAKVASGSTFHAAAAAFPQVFEFQWIEAIRTGEVTGKMASVLVELNKQIRDSRETKRKVKAALMYPMYPDLCCRDRRDGHALDGGADVRQDVQRHGSQAPRDHPVCGGRLGLHRRNTGSIRHRRRDRGIVAFKKFMKTEPDAGMSAAP